MSMGPMSSLGSIAGTPYAQRSGSDKDKSAQETNHAQRRTTTDAKAEAAAGVGSTDTDEQFTSDRDADGRRLWEAPPETAGEGEEQPGEPHDSSRGPRDPHGHSGTQLDLSG